MATLDELQSHSGTSGIIIDWNARFVSTKICIPLILPLQKNDMEKKTLLKKNPQKETMLETQTCLGQKLP